MKTSMRYAGVAIAIFSWIAISNHCAFAAIAAKTDLAQTACPFHSKPEKQKEQSSQVQCCKILRAVAPTIAKRWTRSDSVFSDIEFRLEYHSLVALSRNPPLPLLL